MENISIYITLLLAHLLAVISPGPDFVLTVKNTISNNRKIGTITAFGFGVGILFHTILNVYGISNLISSSETVLNFVKFLGASYLIYLGLSSTRSKGTVIKMEEDKKLISEKKAFLDGLITNIFNPKAILFFIALFSSVANFPNKFVILFIGFIMAINTFLWFSIVSFVISNKKFKPFLENYSSTIDKSLGIILIILGIYILSSLLHF